MKSLAASVFQSPNRVKPLSNMPTTHTPPSSIKERFQSPNRVKPLSNDTFGIGPISTTMFQSPNRVKPLSNLLSALRPMDGPQLFQSPNRVKPLSNVFRHERCQYLFSVSIAQSRQTSFQPVCHPRSAPGEQGFNRPIASNLFPTCARRAVYALILYRFNRPIASNLFPTPFQDTNAALAVLFQSPNRVKPLSNVASNPNRLVLAVVSIAQSRQTSFQHIGHFAVGVGNDTVSIAQ